MRVLFKKEIVLIVAGILLGLPRAYAAEPSVLTYEVYAGGVHVVQANLTMDLEKSTYQADLQAVTRGMLAKLVPWSGAFKTNGAHTGDTYVVRHHESVSTWKGADDKAIYDYDSRGRFKSLKMTDDGVDKTPPSIDPALTTGTTDILTATLNMMAHAGLSNTCDYDADIFDSRRRFTLSYTPQGIENLNKSKYNIYNGPAMKCTAEVIPKGGAWHKKPRGWLSIQEQGRAKGTLPTLWVATVDPSIPPVPVRIMIKTDYGTMFVHLASVQVAGKVYTVPK